VLTRPRGSFGVTQFPIQLFSRTLGDTPQILARELTTRAGDDPPRYPRSNSGEKYGDLISHSWREHVDVTLHVFPVQRKAGEGLTHVRSQLFNSLRSPAGFETVCPTLSSLFHFLAHPERVHVFLSGRIFRDSSPGHLLSLSPPVSDILSRFLFNSPSLLVLLVLRHYTTLTNFIRGRSRDSART